MDYFFHKKIEVPAIPTTVRDGSTTLNTDDETVIVIGAGIAGLMAANTLKRLGASNYVILEASSRFGGRIHRSNDFGALPIDLGAEIIHLGPEVGPSFVKDILVFDENNDMETVEFCPQTWQFGKHRRDLIRHVYRETRFGNGGTWSEWLEKNLYEHVKDNVKCNAVVKHIDYSSLSVAVTTTDGSVYKGTKVICTVPLGVLQSGTIQFQPELPLYKRDAIKNIPWLDGLKVFFKMKTAFFADMGSVRPLWEFVYEEEEIFACFNEYVGRGDPSASERVKDAEPIMVFVITGKHYEEFRSMTDEEIGRAVLRYIDKIYNGEGSRNYIEHIVENYTTKPFIRGAWSKPGADKSRNKALGQSVDDKLFFAGEATHGEFPSYVHGAALSGRRAAVEAVLGINIEENKKAPCFFM